MTKCLSSNTESCASLTSAKARLTQHTIFQTSSRSQNKAARNQYVNSCQIAQRRLLRASNQLQRSVYGTVTSFSPSLLLEMQRLKAAHSSKHCGCCAMSTWPTSNLYLLLIALLLNVDRKCHARNARDPYPSGTTAEPTSD